MAENSTCEVFRLGGAKAGGRMCFEKVRHCSFVTRLLLYFHINRPYPQPPLYAAALTELCSTLPTVIAWQMSAPHTFIPRWNYLRRSLLRAEGCVRARWQLHQTLTYLWSTSANRYPGVDLVFNTGSLWYRRPRLIVSGIKAGFLYLERNKFDRAECNFSRWFPND